MNEPVFFFAGWAPIARILLIGIVGYLTLVLMLRAAGKRTLARMTTFDFIITVSLGASFGRVLTAKEVAIVEALTAFAVLILLHVASTLLRVRSREFALWADGAPVLLYYQGRFLRDAMRRERIDQEALETAIRRSGQGSLSAVAAIVMETDGEFAIIPKDSSGDGQLLEKLEGDQR
jgi:uncharacterized membrane protein YcaP (DUF421 family)